MEKVRIESERYMEKCVKCGHLGFFHQEKDHRDQQRSRKIMGKLVNCGKCDCKQFMPSKKKI